MLNVVGSLTRPAPPRRDAALPRQGRREVHGATNKERQARARRRVGEPAVSRYRGVRMEYVEVTKRPKTMREPTFSMLIKKNAL